MINVFLDQQRDVVVLEYIIFGAESKNFKLGKQFLLSIVLGRGLLDISTCRYNYKWNTQAQGPFFNKSISQRVRVY